MNDSTIQLYETQQDVRGVRDLAVAGVEFTLPNRGNKRPFTTGWPSYRPGLATVAQHLAVGHNLGVHATGYADGRVLSYFDGDDGAGMAALLQIAPELADSLRSWRDSGSGKIFFWTSPDGLNQQSTPNLDGPHTKRELKVSGQAAIFGVHPFGERYETNWFVPIFITVDRVKEIWLAWTGQEWKEGRKRTKAEPGQGYIRQDGDDVDRVKAAWTPSGVFAHHWPGAEMVKEGNRETRILGNGGLLCNDKDGLWHSFAEQTGGDVFNAWAYATNRDIDRDFPAILREMAAAKGIIITPRQRHKDGDPVDPGAHIGNEDAAAMMGRTVTETPPWADAADTAPTVHYSDTDTGGQAGGGGIVGQINRLRLRLRSVDFAELVPSELQSATGYRTGDRDRVVADTALGYLWELRTLEARISNLELSERTGYSAGSCGAAMKRLVNIFQPVDPDEQGKQANRYRINDALHCDTGSTVLVVSQSSASVLATHRAHDLFVRSLSAITPEQVAERDAQRLADGVKPMRRNRQLAARLAAEADALGPAALRLVDALSMYGPMSGGHLAAVLHKSATAARRVVTQTIDAGLVVEVEKGAFALAGGWSERVSELDLIVPTYGTLARRALAAADSRLRYCDSALQTVTDRAKAEELRRRKERAEAQKWALLQVGVISYNERAAAAGLAGVTVEQALRPGRGETFPDWQRRQVMDAQIDELAIRGFAQTLVGLDRQTAEQTAYYAGYSAYEFAQAWALRAIV